MIIDWKNWDDEENKEAWKKLRSQHDVTELMYAFYGAVLLGEIKIEGSMVGLKKHFQPGTDVSFALKEAHEIADNFITYESVVSVADIQAIGDTYKFTEQEKIDHKGLFTEDDLKNVHVSIQISCDEMDFE